MVRGSRLTRTSKCSPMSRVTPLVRDFLCLPSLHLLRSSEMIASPAALAGVVLGAGREEEGRPLLVFQPSGVGEESEEWRGS